MKASIIKLGLAAISGFIFSGSPCQASQLTKEVTDHMASHNYSQEEIKLFQKHCGEYAGLAGMTPEQIMELSKTNPIIRVYVGYHLIQQDDKELKAAGYIGLKSGIDMCKKFEPYRIVLRYLFREEGVDYDTIEKMIEES